MGGIAVRDLVRRPIATRDPVGYDRNLLADYVPGVNRYLPERLKRELHELGRTPDQDRPAGTYAKDILEQRKA